MKIQNDLCSKNIVKKYQRRIDVDEASQHSSTETMSHKMRVPVVVELEHVADTSG